MPAPIVAFQDYPIINQAYAEVRPKIESYLQKWNDKHPDQKFAALDLWIMGYFHFCIPSATKPIPLGADQLKVQQRLRSILYPIIEDSSNTLTPAKYASILKNPEHLRIFLERLTASRRDNPTITPYIIPGTATTFKNLYHAGYIKPGEKIILRANKRDYESVVNANGMVKIVIDGIIREFDSPSKAGREGIQYKGFVQWGFAYVIQQDGKRKLLEDYRIRFEQENPFPAHFDSPESTKSSVFSTKVPVTNIGRDDEFYEGSIHRISVEIRQRDAAARRACIDHHKAKCFICDFDFGQIYGPEVDGFIHVHHRVMLSKSTAKRKVDPINDLIPLCPNCHSVVHLRKDAYEVEEVRKMMERQQTEVKK